MLHAGCNYGVMGAKEAGLKCRHSRNGNHVCRHGLVVHAGIMRALAQTSKHNGQWVERLDYWLKYNHLPMPQWTAASAAA